MSRARVIISALLFLSLVGAAIAIGFVTNTHQDKYQVHGDTSLCLKQIAAAAPHIGSDVRLDQIWIQIVPVKDVSKTDAHFRYYPLIASWADQIQIGLRRHFSFSASPGVYRVWMLVGSAEDFRGSWGAWAFGVPDHSTGVFMVKSTGVNHLPKSLSCASLGAWRQLVIKGG